MFYGIDQQIVNRPRGKVVLSRGVARIDANAAQLVTNEVPLGVERRLKAVPHRRAVASPLHIIFTRPDQFYRRLENAGKFCGLKGKVGLQSPPESSSQSCAFKRNPFGRTAEPLSRLRASGTPRVGWPSQLDPIVANMRTVVRALHRPR